MPHHPTNPIEEKEIQRLYDIIPDIHGQSEKLSHLLAKLGWRRGVAGWTNDDELGIEHRLAPPMRPLTNGMVEPFNGWIEDVPQSHRFRSGEDLEQTILRYVRLYIGQLPQLVLKGRTPIATLKDWHRQRPNLFKKRPYNHTGCDT